MKFLAVLVLAGSLVACNGGTVSAGAKVDSTVNKLDSAGKAILDSTKEGLKDLKAKGDEIFDGKDKKKDTVEKH